jgi:four helix bundle protein
VLLEEGAVPQRESADRLRRAAVSIPSLVAEAFLDTETNDPVEVLARACARLGEVQDLLAREPLATAMPDEDRQGLLDQIERLVGELERLRVSRQVGSSGYVA